MHAQIKAQAERSRNERCRNRPVDLAHLARQTYGNRDLEREVLQLFIRQSEIYLARFAESGAQPAEIAHVLLGSARGIGAHAVAEAAAALEQMARDGADIGAADIAQLRKEVEHANAFIRDLVAA